MKKFIFAVFAGSLFVLFSCHRGASNESAASKMVDSIKIADSVSGARADVIERQQFEALMQREIDSLDRRMNHMDSFYHNRSAKEQQNYAEQSGRMRSRIESLKQRKNTVNTIARKDWDQFKTGVDTAMNGLNRDMDKIFKPRRGR